MQMISSLSTSASTLRHTASSQALAIARHQSDLAMMRDRMSTATRQIADLRGEGKAMECEKRVIECEMEDVLGQLRVALVEKHDAERHVQELRSRAEGVEGVVGELRMEIAGKCIQIEQGNKRVLQLQKQVQKGKIRLT
jgi:chromosome segregation ATPase